MPIYHTMQLRVTRCARLAIWESTSPPNGGQHRPADPSAHQTKLYDATVGHSKLRHTVSLRHTSCYATMQHHAARSERAGLGLNRGHFLEVFWGWSQECFKDGFASKQLQGNCECVDLRPHRCVYSLRSCDVHASCCGVHTGLPALRCV